MKKILLCFLVCITASLSAQSDTLSIYGTITDEQGESVPFANVSLLQEGNQILGTTTDFDGHYRLKPITPGMYNLKISYVGYQTKTIGGIQLNGINLEVNGILEKGIEIGGCILWCTPPVFRKDETTSGRTFSREEIRRMPF